MIVDKNGMIWSVIDYYNALVADGINEETAREEVRLLGSNRSLVEPFLAPTPVNKP